LLLSFDESSAQTKNTTKRPISFNPVLRMIFDPSKVKYEEFPVQFKLTCAKLLAHETNKMIYARVRLGDSEYLAERGNISDPEEEAMNIGDIIWIRGNSCQPLGIDLTLSSLPPKNGYRAAASKDTFPNQDSPNECVPGQCHYVFRSAQEEELLHNFVRDAIQRAIKAYGGDSSFRAHACKPEEEKELSEAGYVIVLQELRAYCSNAHR
jgi:hypothetical protein